MILQFQFIELNINGQFASSTIPLPIGTFHLIIRVFIWNILTKRSFYRDQIGRPESLTHPTQLLKFSVTNTADSEHV